jgi:type I restriction enzyme S subunit
MNKKNMIKDICDIYDGPHATPKRTNDGPVYLGIKAISEDGTLLPHEFTFLSETDYKKWTKRITPIENDIVFSYEATLDRYAIIPKGFYGCLGRRLAIIRAKSDKVNIKWLYYYFKSPEWKTFITNHIISGSTVNRISINDFPFYPISLPRRAIQDNIVMILENIDHKIRLNNTINAELEKVAKTLYNYWFVQFDFSNAKGKPYRTSGGKMEYNEVLKREIPKGWEAERFIDLATITTGKEDANFSTRDGSYNFFTCGRDILRCDKPAFNGQAVLLAGNGDFNVKHYTGEFNAYQRTYVLTPKHSAHYAAMYIAASDKVAELKMGAYGSIVKFITISDVANIALPVNHEYNYLFEKLTVIINEIELLERENDELIKLRDFLLPLLMNGQVRVSEMGINGENRCRY